MELPLGTLVVTIIASILVGVVVIGVCGLVLYQIFVKKRRKPKRRDIEDIEQTPTLALKGKGTLRKGQRRDFPFIKTHSNTGQQKHAHTSWTVPLTLSSPGRRTRGDVANLLVPSYPRGLRDSLQNASSDSSDVSDRTIVIKRSSGFPASSYNSILKREQDLFDPNYSPIARRSAPTEPSRERTPSLSPRSHHRRIFSHPADIPKIQEARRASSLTKTMDRDYSSWLHGQRRSKSLDGILASDEAKSFTRSTRDSAIDITSPPASSNSAKRQSIEMSDAKFLEYAAGGQWLTSGGKSPSEISSHIPPSPSKSSSPMQGPSHHLDDGPESIPSHSKNSQDSGPEQRGSSNGLVALEQPQTAFELHKRYPRSILPSTQGHTLTPLDESSEPNSSLDSVFSCSEFMQRNVSLISGPVVTHSRRHTGEQTSKPLVPPVLPLTHTTDEQTRLSSPSPTLSARSVDSEALSEVTISNLSGLTPRPRKVEEMFQPIEEEIIYPLSFGKALPFGDVNSTTAWSPSILSLNADSFPFPLSNPPSIPLPIEAPELNHISSVYGINTGFKTPRESLVVSELERAVREMGDRLQWLETDDDRTPVPGTPIADKGKVAVRDIIPEPEHRLGTPSRFEERRPLTFN